MSCFVSCTEETTEMSLIRLFQNDILSIKQKSARTCHSLRKHWLYIKDGCSHSDITRWFLDSLKPGAKSVQGNSSTLYSSLSIEINCKLALGQQRAPVSQWLKVALQYCDGHHVGFTEQRCEHIYWQTQLASCFQKLCGCITQVQISANKC